MSKNDYDDRSSACPRFDDPMGEGTTLQDISFTVGSLSQAFGSGREALKEAFIQRYMAYMCPEKPLSAYRTQCLLDDLYRLLYRLNAAWAYHKTAGYLSAGFLGADMELALHTGCCEAYEVLMQDKADGNLVDKPVSYYLTIAQRRSIDQYFRQEFGRLPRRKADETDEAYARRISESPRKEPYQVSLDAMMTDQDGVYRADRSGIAATDPFGDAALSRREDLHKSTQLLTLYVRELMNYPNDPQKPLAVMYGQLMFLAEKEWGGDDELAGIARKSTKKASPAWAHKKMGDGNLRELGEESQQFVRKYYRSSLSWGPSFREKLRQDAGNGGSWGDIVYTRTYTEGNTSNWIESLSKSTRVKCARIAAADSEMAAYAREFPDINDQIRSEIEKIEKKEASR